MSSYNQYPRGAEWRKRYLHVHTPASFHWNDGKCFAQMSSGGKTAALKKMYAAIEQSDVAAFAIMDYWTFDGGRITTDAGAVFSWILWRVLLFAVVYILWGSCTVREVKDIGERWKTGLRSSN